MKTIKILYGVTILILCICTESYTQSLTEPELRIVPSENEVHVYHTKLLSAGMGFNIYRQDEPGGAFIRLNEEPQRGAQRSDELRIMLGDRYERTLKIFEAENAGELWMKLRSNPIESAITSLIFPEFARAFGWLYVDDTAPIHRLVTYRIEFVDNLGRPTGEEMSKTIFLQPRLPDPPVITRAENTGLMVRLHWRYPRMLNDEDDFVTNFYLYRIDHHTGRLQRITDEIVIRNNAYDTHQFYFESPVINTTEQYVITAVDVTGQQSRPSQIFEFELIYNIPPPPITGISALVTLEQWVELSWERRIQPHIAGYRVYRGTDFSQPFTLLTEELINPGEAYYLDTTVSGGQVYYYTITVVDEVGNESEHGDFAMAQVLDLIPPLPPKNLAARYNTETATVELQWEVDKLTPNFETFIVLRRREDISQPGAFTRINPESIRETGFIDRGGVEAGFTEGGHYRYVVYSASRARIYSDTVSIVIPIPLITPPAPPTNVRGVNDGGFRINVTWNPSPSTRLGEYVVYRKTDMMPSFEELLRVPPENRFIRDEKVEIGTTYIYTVAAVDTSGNESAYAVFDTLFFISFNPPRSVRNLQAADRGDGVALQWEPVTSPGIAGYKIYRAAVQTGRYQSLHEGLVTEPHFFDYSGTSDLWYRVSAVDISGNESRSGKAVRPISRSD